MTPAALLVAFCAVMAAIALWRLATDECRDRVDIGSTLVVVGFTLLSAWWTTLETALLTAVGQALLAVGGFGFGAAGVGLIVRYWDESSPRSSEG